MTTPANPLSFITKPWKAGLEITGYEGEPGEELAIPGEIDGRPVLRVGAKAFQTCKSLRSVSFPDGQRAIGKSAFQFCKLKSVTFPEGVAAIGDSAFRGCFQLAKAALPESLQEIGREAFPEKISFTAPEGSWAAQWLAKR